MRARADLEVTAGKTITNRGDFRVDSPGKVMGNDGGAQDKWTFTNNKNLFLGKGELKNNNLVRGQGSQIFKVQAAIPGGDDTFYAYGSVEGGGTIDVQSGTLSIVGDFTQTGTPKVGLASSSSYSVLSVSGLATLGGTLDVDLLGGFTPTPGMGFTPLTYGSRSGTFATVDLPPLGFGVWHHGYDANSCDLWISYF